MFDVRCLIGGFSRKDESAFTVLPSEVETSKNHPVTPTEAEVYPSAFNIPARLIRSDER